MESLSTVVPARAGTNRAAGRLFPVWQRLSDALLRGLSMADPWVTASVATTDEE